MMTYKSFLITGALLFSGAATRVIFRPPTAVLHETIASINEHYQAHNGSTAYKKISQEIGLFTPQMGVFLDNPEIAILLGTPEEDIFIYSDDFQRPYINPIYEDNPVLAALVPPQSALDSKNFWFDVYDEYCQIYAPEQHKAKIEQLASFQDASGIQAELYKQMLADLDIPFRKPLKVFSDATSAKMGSLGFTYNDQIAICGDLSFERFRTTLYHEGQHLKNHDSPKIVLLQAIVNRELERCTDLYDQESTYVKAIQALNDYRKFIEHRADYTTYYDHINCYKCTQTKAKTVRQGDAERISKGYISYEELHKIGQEQEKSNLLCAYHCN